MIWSTDYSVEKLILRFRPTIESGKRIKVKAVALDAGTFPVHDVPPQIFKPMWRNWQTRWIQNPVSAMTCGFESHHRHYTANGMRSMVEI